MKILVFLGPPGAGKTTLARNTFAKGGLSGKSAYVFNDEGTSETVDAKALAGHTDFRPMTAGCFGCADSKKLIDLVRKLEASTEYDWLIIEPLGFIAGHELPQLFASHGISVHIFTLVDVQHWEQNLLLGIVESQVQAATLGIGLTKSDTTDPSDPRLVQVLNYLGHHAPGKPIYLVPPGGELPEVSFRTRLVLPMVEEGHVHGPGCGHDHHDHDHAHGFATYHFFLRADVTFADVQTALANLAAVIRAKGAIEGQQFQMVHGTWEQTVADGGRYVTLYATEPTDVAQLEHLFEPPETEATGTTQQLLRRGDMPLEESIALVRELLSRAPREVVMTPDGPVAKPELGELLHELRKRPGIPKDLIAECIRYRVDYALAVMAECPPGSIWWNTPEAHVWQADVAITVGWFALHKPDILGAERLQRARDLNLGAFLAAGLAGQTSLNSDPVRAATFVSEATDTITFLGRIDAHPDLRTAVAHCAELTERQYGAAMAQPWGQVL